MKLKNKVIFSSILAIGSLVSSFVFPVIPCQIIANVPNPESGYSLCSLNTFSSQSYDSLISFFGYTDSLIISYLIILASTFCLGFVFLTIFSRKSKK